VSGETFDEGPTIRRMERAAARLVTLLAVCTMALLASGTAALLILLWRTLYG
jgi:dTDP-4-amino-4,6-dideoxygalactose transaminase